LKLDSTRVDAFRGIEAALKAMNDPGRAAQAEERRRQIEGIEARLSNLRSSSLKFTEKGPGFLEIAKLYREVGALRETGKFLQLAREASPDLAAAYRALAEITVAPGECFMRANCLANLIRLKPEDAAARKSLSSIYTQIGVRLDRARELAEEAKGDSVSSPSKNPSAAQEASTK
jgi:hypothetical protein